MLTHEVIQAVNHAPVAQDQAVTTDQDTPVAITLVATDADNDPLTYSIVTQPAHGTLAGTAPNVTYTPAGGYVGSDSFTFKANDGQVDSNVATVNLAVNFVFTGFVSPVDNPPAVNAVNGGQAIPVKFSLGGSYGLNIFAAGYPQSQQIDCSSGALIGATEATASTSGLKYGGNQYNYGWKTDKAWSGMCRQLTVRLIDGTEHTALFQFKGKAKAAGDEADDSGSQIFLPLVSQ